MVEYIDTFTKIKSNIGLLVKGGIYWYPQKNLNSPPNVYPQKNFLTTNKI